MGIGLNVPGNTETKKVTAKSDSSTTDVKKTSDFHLVSHLKMIILFIIALIYTILPDPVPGPVDDAAVDGALGIAILVLKIVAEQKASKFVKDHKDEYIRAIGSKISNESVKQVYDSEIKKASDAWEVREKQKSENLAAQVSQAKTKYAADSTHAETTQNSMDVF